MARTDLRYLEEGTYIIITKARSLGEGQYVVKYSRSYRRLWRYWLTNPDNLPEPDGWMIVRRIAGCNVVVNPIPPDRLKKLGMVVALMACTYAGLDGMDGKFDHVVHWCRIAAEIVGTHIMRIVS